MKNSVAFTVFVFLALLLSARSQEAISPDLARLKTGYQSAVTKAVTPLTVTYRKELERLLENLTRAGKLDEALQVKNELATLDATGVTKTAKDATSPPAPTEQLPAITVERTVWVSKSGFIASIEFLEKGAMTVTNQDGKKYTGWRYQQAQDGSVVITPSGPKPTPASFRYTNQGATYIDGGGAKQQFKLENGRKK